MGTRLQLHDILTAILSSDHAYFQPPASINLEYPCIKYKKTHIKTKHANNELYSQKTRYQVTVIDSNPDSTLGLDVLALPLCNYDRNFTTDGLHHEVFEVYF